MNNLTPAERETLLALRDGPRYYYSLPDDARMVIPTLHHERGLLELVGRAEDSIYGLSDAGRAALAPQFRKGEYIDITGGVDSARFVRGMRDGEAVADTIDPVTPKIADALAVLTREHPTPWVYADDAIEDADGNRLLEPFQTSNESVEALVRLINALAAVAQAEGREAQP